MILLACKIIMRLLNLEKPAVRLPELDPVPEQAATRRLTDGLRQMAASP